MCVGESADGEVGVRRQSYTEEERINSGAARRQM